MCCSFMRDKLKPVVKTEEQFLFVCHLVGPFFQRFHIERTRCMLDVSYTSKYTLFIIIIIITEFLVRLLNEEHTGRCITES